MNPPNGNVNSVRVEIFDQAYNLRGTDPEYISKLAEFVDMKMRAVAEQTQTVDSLRLAVLAALNIADEFSRYRLQREKTAGIWIERTEEITDRLSKVIS